MFSLAFSFMCQSVTLAVAVFYGDVSYASLRQHVYEILLVREKLRKLRIFETLFERINVQRVYFSRKLCLKIKENSRNITNKYVELESSALGMWALSYVRKWLLNIV
jgi:hypothetical protein